METNNVFETTRFVVKDPPKFREEFYANSVRIALDENEKGFVLSGQESNFSMCINDEELDETDEDSVALFIKDHLREDQQVQIKWLYYNSRVGEKGPTDLFATFYLVTADSMERLDDDEIFKSLKQTIMPRRVSCLLSVNNKAKGTWIEAGKDYLAVAEVKRHNRPSYVIKHDDGTEIYWGKEYFI